jgi:hypothetical protein
VNQDNSRLGRRLLSRYPSTLEEFYKCRLPDTWEEEKAGKRMKLPTPETWETQVSLKGNKAATWEDLLGEETILALFTGTKFSHTDISRVVPQT